MGLLRKILAPFSSLYGKITDIRNTFYDKGILKSTSFSVPVIVVGNLTVGGTGKTPQVEYLARLLKKKYKVAILSRGYKRKTKGFVLADENTAPTDIGDEPMQYHAKFKDVLVAVDANRVEGINKLLEFKEPPQIILLDDAYQHRKVEAGLNILLTSYNDLYVDDKMLPAGNLREKVKGASRAQIIVVTKCPDSLSEKEQFEVAKKLNVVLHQTVFFSTIRYDSKIISKANSIDLEELTNYEVVLVTGIANTTPLVEFLHEKEISIKHLQYADHHNFSKADITFIRDTLANTFSSKKLILTTEKDYVRSFMTLEDDIYYLPIETKFIEHEKDFNKIIKDYVERNTTNS
ncbi:MAG: tetraacyldisaccharide 4'-kinase [Flavobacteriaceae bacterium]|nr:tetraacyldisaccharide 4'-kinase [Flavobacteriaceae bacterium]